MAERFSLPGEVSGKYSILKDEDSTHLAHCQIAHGRHHGIPECGGMKKAKYFDWYDMICLKKKLI